MIEVESQRPLVGSVNITVALEQSKAQRQNEDESLEC